MKDREEIKAVELAGDGAIELCIRLELRDSVLKSSYPHSKDE